MRVKPVVQIEYYEDIISYECNYPGKFIKILVGVGTLNELGEFVPNDNQNFEPVIIDYNDFLELMAASDTKPQNVFRKDDLWVYVDRNRQKIKEQYDIGAAVLATEAENSTPATPMLKSVRK